MIQDYFFSMRRNVVVALLLLCVVAVSCHKKEAVVPETPIAVPEPALSLGGGEWTISSGDSAPAYSLLLAATANFMSGNAFQASDTGWVFTRDGEHKSKKYPWDTYVHYGWKAYSNPVCRLSLLQVDQSWLISLSTPDSALKIEVHPYRYEFKSVSIIPLSSQSWVVDADTMNFRPGMPVGGATQPPYILSARGDYYHLGSLTGADKNGVPYYLFRIKRRK